MTIIAQRINSETLAGLFSEKKYKIDKDNWNLSNDAEVDFNFGYDSDNIYLKFFVKESNTVAVYTDINQPVYEDSCVEFFISFDKENYYNLEFNCIGNILGGYGKNRDNRKVIDPIVLQKIERTPSLGFNRINKIEERIEWTLELVIPKEIFVHDKIITFDGLEVSCNFYKCGDKQVVPHYLSWSPIISDEPNFHMPEYFGKVWLNFS